MTDNRMTDEEIRDAMACCMKSECKNCPNRGAEDCVDNLIAQWLGLINRQQEQIEAAIAEQINPVIIKSNIEFMSGIKSFANRLFNKGDKQ